MALKKYKPTTSSQRYKLISAFVEVTTSKPEKSLLAPIHKSGGRNSRGKMTIRYRGGGHKRRYRMIDFKRDKDNVEATVSSIEYDPNRTARIALLEYGDGEKRYIVAPHGLKVGQKIMSGEKASPSVGNALFLKDIPYGTILHSIELRPGQGAKMARSAGSHAQLLSREGKFAILKLPSGETRMVLKNCKASIGMVSNVDHSIEISGKAGRSRWKGRRPRTRPVAMNPVDHPMGGGEGRASGGLPRSRKAVPAKGYKTRKPKKDSNRYIIERRKKKRK
ncbi:MAG: 50S ribosomal protein L2 [Bacteroidales bacterium]|nr:50S ribosomal protein L2 [Bacteroidales bacterium]MCF8333822.1 50S ribosomal protein L2 [Bacteroidales bacterium]